jgi:putative transposase
VDRGPWLRHERECGASLNVVKHVHLLVKETGGDVIAQSMQLIAGRTAQEYNRRKNRHGVFWEDRHHATAIQADDHLHQCVVYIDLTMVRA